MENQKRQGKVLLLVAMTGFISMGNEGCEKDDGKRKLKLEVEVGAIQAQPIRGPNGELINFPFVTNALFYRQVMNSSYFTISNPIPSPSSSVPRTFAQSMNEKVSQGTAAIGDGALAASDVKLLSEFGFLNQLNKTTTPGKSSEKLSAYSATDSSDVPACLYNVPQAELYGDMISFELTSGGGIGIGWGAGGPLDIGAISGNFSFQSSRLEIALRADDPLTQQVTAIGDGVSHQEKFKVGLSLPIGVPLGLDFFFSEPIANTVRAAFTKGLNSIVKSLVIQKSPKKTWDDTWESRVVYDPEIANGDTHIVIRGGTRAAMQPGDTFNIYNLHYRWEGEPCSSRLKYKIPLSQYPIAEASIVQIGDNIAVAEVKYLQDARILPGAQVKLKQLYVPPTPTPAPKKTPKEST